MRGYVRGRTLGVKLDREGSNPGEQLRRLGFAADRADAVASAAKKYAEEETDLLSRQLTPRSVWKGMAFVHRHFIQPKEEIWLMLKFDGEGWTLDSAFFS